MLRQQRVNISRRRWSRCAAGTRVTTEGIRAALLLQAHPNLVTRCTVVGGAWDYQIWSFRPAVTVTTFPVTGPVHAAIDRCPEGSYWSSTQRVLARQVGFATQAAVARMALLFMVHVAILLNNAAIYRFGLSAYAKCG